MAPGDGGRPESVSLGIWGTLREMETAWRGSDELFESLDDRFQSADDLRIIGLLGAVAQVGERALELPCDRALILDFLG